MKHSQNSSSFIFIGPVRASLAATCALALGATALFGQASTTPSTSTSTSGSSTYGTGTASPSSGNYNSNTTRSSTGSYDTTSASGGSANYSQGKLSFTERRFVNKAADSNKEEIQIAQLAAQKATNAEVRSYAQSLVDAHSKVNTELLTLAGSKSVKLDQDDGRGITYRRLSNKTGAEFDQEFVEHMIDEHEDNVRMFEKAAADSKDADLRSFASSHVAALREHLQKAQALRASTMPTGRDSDYSGRSDAIAPATPNAPMSRASNATNSSIEPSTQSTSGSTTDRAIGDKASGADRSGDYTTGSPSSSSTTTGTAVR